MDQAYRVGNASAFDGGVSKGFNTIKDDVVQLRQVLDVSGMKHCEHARFDISALTFAEASNWYSYLGAAPRLAVDGLQPEAPPAGEHDIATREVRELGRAGGDSSSPKMNSWRFSLDDFIPKTTVITGDRHPGVPGAAERDAQVSDAQGAKVASSMLMSIQADWLPWARSPGSRDVGVADRELNYVSPLETFALGRASGSVTESYPAGYLDQLAGRAVPASRFGRAGPRLNQSSPSNAQQAAEYDRPAVEFPQDRSGTSGNAVPPIAGDVYLDGNRVGRWIGNQLARAVNRPAANGSHFDARQSPSWAGTSVGF